MTEKKAPKVTPNMICPCGVLPHESRLKWDEDGGGWWCKCNGCEQFLYYTPEMFEGVGHLPDENLSEK